MVFYLNILFDATNLFIVSVWKVTDNAQGVWFRGWKGLLQSFADFAYIKIYTI
jgi:hypothetical protein